MWTWEFDGIAATRRLCKQFYLYESRSDFTCTWFDAMRRSARDVLHCYHGPSYRLIRIIRLPVLPDFNLSIILYYTLRTYDSQKRKRRKKNSYTSLRQEHVNRCKTLIWMWLAFYLAFISFRIRNAWPRKNMKQKTMQ